ncbi:hypothetical protein N0V88_000029 [Collariella sp. IMI 366227]|nr:hypothetical protein N0V88_000029 [Collariella sp. IMI 366227]
MAFPLASMCNMRLDFDDETEFHFRDLSPDCSTSSISGASCASSYGSPAPTSGRSTPSFSTALDFGPSFSSSFVSSVDSNSFDLSPPSSATSTYFPMSPKHAHASEFAYPGLPMTHHFSCPPPMPHSQAIDWSFYMNPLSQPMLTTLSAAPTYEHIPAPVSHWAHTDSPISFQKSPLQITPPHTVKQEPREDMMARESSTAAARKRARAESLRLQQQVQHHHYHHEQPAAPSHSHKHEKQHLPPLSTTDDLDVEADDVVEPGKYRCPEESKHDKDEIIYACNWCNRKVNRKDNFISHLKLHTVPGRKARVKYEPGAVAQYQEEIRKFKPRRRQSKA